METRLEEAIRKNSALLLKIRSDKNLDPLRDLNEMETINILRELLFVRDGKRYLLKEFTKKMLISNSK